MRKINLFGTIKQIVKLIPPGKVSTYQNVASAAGSSDPRVVGWALRGNENADIPCHRVVKKGGVLASNFSLGNWPEQRRRLESEGLKFDGQQVLNFEDHFFDVSK